MKASHAVAIVLALAGAVFSVAAVAQQAVIPGVGGVVKHGIIDINTASEQTLAAIPTIGSQTARAIIAQRSKGPFKSSADFAARLCGQHSVDFGFETTVKIQNEMHAPRGSDPKSPTFKCAVGQSTFETSGQKFGWDVRTTQVK